MVEEKIVAKGNFDLWKYPAFITLGIAIILLILGIINEWFEWDGDQIIIIGIEAILFAVAIEFILRWKFCELTVTNSRVYGKYKTIGRVDIPLSQISSTGTSFPLSIIISSSSGIIKFSLVSNQKEIYEKISELIRNM